MMFIMMIRILIGSAQSNSRNKVDNCSSPYKISSDSLLHVKLMHAKE